MSTSNSFEGDVKLWLCKILKHEKLEHISVTVTGKSDKGEGYVGDIVFVDVTGSASDKSTKEYNLALKCSKQNQVIREHERFQNMFKNEIFFYKELLPTFTELVNNLRAPLIRVPKCYGTLTEENIEIIALENLKNNGYELWPRNQPLTRKHIDLVIRAYAQFHAASIHLKQQNSQKFEQLLEKCKVKRFFTSDRIFKPCFQESLQLLKNEVSAKSLEKWKRLSESIIFVFEKVENNDNMKVFIHGDCWSNNFMYKGHDGIPTDVVILDWQIVRYASPICDLSYFLFSCISEEDIENIDDILQEYYEHFSESLRNLGASNNYTFDQLMDDWKNYSTFGVILSTMLIKMCTTDKEHVVDVSEMVTRSRSVGTWYDPVKEPRNDVFKNRMRYIVKYLVKKNLI